MLSEIASGILVLIGGYLWVRAYLRRWEREDQRLNSEPEMATYFVELAPGIKNSPELWAHGHEKAGERLSPLGVTAGFMSRLWPGDTTSTVTPTLRCPLEHASFIQSCYTTYLPEGHLGFIPVPPEEDPYAESHAGIVVAHKHSEPDQIRKWMLHRLRAWRLA